MTDSLGPDFSQNRESSAVYLPKKFLENAEAEIQYESAMREEIAQDIERASKAGPITNELDEYWVAGLNYAANIVRGEK